jgi:hypothetical protein
MRFREATGADAMAVATLHAESWRAFYRGAYRDEYLDGDVVEDRLRVWEERLSTPAPYQFVVLAEEEDELIGFACAYGGHDETWGSFLDNIHVRPKHQPQFLHHPEGHDRPTGTIGIVAIFFPPTCGSLVHIDCSKSWANQPGCATCLIFASGPAGQYLARRRTDPKANAGR